VIFYFLFWACWASFWIGVISNHHGWQAIGWWFYRRGMWRLAVDEEYLAFLGVQQTRHAPPGCTEAYHRWLVAREMTTYWDRQ
jgi:hypothetical protein